jgi:hypothetical protein
LSFALLPPRRGFGHNRALGNRLRARER